MVGCIRNTSWIQHYRRHHKTSLHRSAGEGLKLVGVCLWLTRSLSPLTHLPWVLPGCIYQLGNWQGIYNLVIGCRFLLIYSGSLFALGIRLITTRLRLIPSSPHARLSIRYLLIYGRIAWKNLLGKPLVSRFILWAFHDNLIRIILFRAGRIHEGCIRFFAGWISRLHTSVQLFAEFFLC